MIKAKNQVKTEITADEIDREKLKKAFAEVRLATTNLQEALQEALLDVLVD